MRWFKHRGNVVLLSALVLMALALCGTVWAIRYTVGTEVKVTQVRALKEPEEDGAGMDEDIPKSARRALKRKFGRKYKQYKLIGKETRLCRLGEDETFSLAEGEELTVHVVGYSPSKKMIDIRLQTKDNVSAVSVKSGTNLIDKLNDDDDPVIVIIRPSLVQTER